MSDFLDENSLRAEARSKTFTFDEKLNIIKNVMTALKESHKENIYHRDINPDNIYLISGYAYLGNFGKSYFSDHNEQGFTVMATINESNATPYHPLELTIGDASRASDIYSLGVLIYWLFAEKEPVKSPYELDKLGGKLPADRLPTAINPSLPKWLNEISLKTILVDDTHRIDSIEELDKLLINFLKSDDSVKDSAKPTTKPNVPQDPYDLKEGDQVEVFTIYQVLGKGGYSTVFKVKHGLQGKEFALKLFNQSVNASSVIDEYNALVDLHHPNIVKFVWNGILPTGQFYTLTELLHGENLSAYTRTDARLPVNRVYHVGKHILSALVEMQAQQKPILHRDIKPQNIIWDKEERFVLIDFNVASSTETNKDFVGTNPYLAPDLVTDNYKVNWDKSADTFALGVTLYELACKQHPWVQKVPSLSLQPLNPKSVEPRLSSTFSDFLAKAISAKKENRFANAQEMLDALLAVGEDNLLEENKTGQVVKVNSEGEEQDFLAYVNSLYSQSKYGNAGTRASFETSAYDKLTYTPTKLDKKLIPAILDGHFKLVVITGNAGDGKTAFIRKIEDAESVTNRERFAHKNGARFRIGSVAFESNYDGSQDEDEKANNEVLESFFKPFENLTSYSNAAEGRIIAINEGRLVEFLKTSDKHHQLANIIEDYFYQEGHRDLPDGVMIINLNLRSVVASEQAHPSLFREQVKALTKKELWSKCNTCPVANQCFIKYNVDSFNDMAAGEEVITRMEWLLRTASLKREMHITMRDLRSFIAFTLTRDNTCEDVKKQLSGGTPESYWEYFYFNVTNPAAKDGGEQDRLVKLLRETDIGEVTVPNLDRDLFFGKHHSRNYLEFAERDLNLISAFNEHKIYVPAHEQDSFILTRIKQIQKSFIRHQYFEGKAPYQKRLPYQSVFEFFDVLKSDNQQNKAILKTKASISRAVSLNEGCDNQGIDQNFLVLSSSEVKDPYSSSYRLFPLDDFELFVNRTDHLVKYLEYEPDSLIFRHNKEKHIQLIISLDLYEMLYFIQKGFSPSLNDLKGKFIELIIFKNLLENLSYHRVVVTRDNLNFFKIEKEANNTLNIQPMDVEYGY
ncbi:serine/threonine-protein kinase [Pontibacter sp. BAB1700]|uniref:serine/threonine-protein kinase n=1 Tax=Pontibacter sp. BAB1700 TaxID=1144253 RepID=UPI002100F655|nr:serine/threonine-protein kinase [Pontibacter sp. BAB1700]